MIARALPLFVILICMASVVRAQEQNQASPVAQSATTPVPASAVDIQWIYLLGSTEGETIRVDLAAIKKSLKSAVLLQPYNWIEVPESGPLTGSRFGSIFADIRTRAAGNRSFPSEFYSHEV